MLYSTTNPLVGLCFIYHNAPSAKSSQGLLVYYYYLTRPLHFFMWFKAMKQLIITPNVIIQNCVNPVSSMCCRLFSEKCLSFRFSTFRFSYVNLLYKGIFGFRA